MWGWFDEGAAMTVETIPGSGGTPIAVERGGAGPALVVVHGTAADRSRWTTIRPMLERDFTVVAVDRRGRGGSGDDGAYSIGREAGDLAAVVRALEAPVLLFGHSHGGICALEAALDLGPELAGLILYEPPLVAGRAGPDDRLDRLDAMLAAGEREQVLVSFMSAFVGMPPAQIETLRASPAWAGRLAAAHTLPREARGIGEYELEPGRLATLSVPVLLLLGGDSPAFFRDGTARLEAALPDVRKVVMPGQQHIAMDTAPELVAEAVRGFWAEIGGR